MNGLMTVERKQRGKGMWTQVDLVGGRLHVRCPGSPSCRNAACLEFQKRGLSERYRSGSETADCKRREGAD